MKLGLWLALASLTVSGCAAQSDAPTAKNTGPAVMNGQGEMAGDHHEDEDQSTGMALKLGLKVRHPQFGISTVLSVEALDDDTKLVVHFVNIGRKTLRAKFARLEPA